MIFHPFFRFPDAHNDMILVVLASMVFVILLASYNSMHSPYASCARSLYNCFYWSVIKVVGLCSFHTLLISDLLLSALITNMAHPIIIAFGYLEYGRLCIWNCVQSLIVLVDCSIAHTCSLETIMFNMIGLKSSLIQSNL